ncbi:DUF1648 domain-containing protein [Chloroflexota bacterium]
MDLAFHWGYIILPVVICALTIILTAIFYPQLPDNVAYHFQSDGSPDRWLSRGTTILWMVLPQLVLTLLAGVFTWGITKLSTRFKQPDGTRIKTERILPLMGNMVALPQIILGFAMLRIFIYNSYQIHIMPLLTFALITMVLGGIILGIFFIRAIKQVLIANR